MTKAEYFVNLHCCHVRCGPRNDGCNDCPYLMRYNEIYKDEEYDGHGKDIQGSRKTV